MHCRIFVRIARLGEEDIESNYRGLGLPDFGDDVSHGGAGNGVLLNLREGGIVEIDEDDFFRWGSVAAVIHKKVVGPVGQIAERDPALQHRNQDGQSHGHNRCDNQAVWKTAHHGWVTSG